MRSANAHDAAEVVVEQEWTAADLAAHWNITPRMVNIYRQEAERLRGGTPLGVKRGRKTYFSREECEAIAQVKQRGIDTTTASARNAQAKAAGDSRATAQANSAEAATLDGMEGVTAQLDNQAIALGQQLGQRFNSLVLATAMQTMAEGMGQLGQTLGELQCSMEGSITGLDLPQLPAAQAVLGEGND